MRIGNPRIWLASLEAHPSSSGALGEHVSRERRLPLAGSFHELAQLFRSHIIARHHELNHGIVQQLIKSVDGIGHLSSSTTTRPSDGVATMTCQ
jgi:hypothetical protein